ncbi:MAG TPA: TIR domain-containing protein, partial [Burkholderiaceae bacterium]|nr:TIR domain-containing protein [Burkholderiaceae bacterium]
MSRFGAFISYARADGEAFATALRERLAQEAPDVRLWQDRLEIEGGVGWWRQIEQALEQVDFLVIVMTPAAIASEITRKEWRAGRQLGVCVFPVQGPGFRLDDPRLPGWMRRTHIYDLERQWSTFVAHLRRGCQPTRVPFMAPPLPSNFVARWREFDLLRSKVLDGDTQDAISIATVLAGAGGFGKTTLAAALCHDEAITDAFDDGVLWATLGQTPNIQGELTRLYAALTGERPGFISIEDAAQALGEKLEHKCCLIVVDDVWDVAQLKPFLRGGPGCARVVTTRQALVAAEGERITVDEMTGSEAVSLLVSGLDQRPTDLQPYSRLAQRLGEWPLLLKLASAAMRQRLERGDSSEGALRYVERALDRRGVTAFDRQRSSDRHEAVLSTIGMSLDLLEPANRERCVELAIFPEDVAVPSVVLGEL